MSEGVDKPNISLFFPVYNDERTVATLTERAISVLEQVAGEYEIVIVNDGSPDRSGQVADEMAARYARVRVVHHERNLGYGRAIQTGFEHARGYEWVCFTDGDNQYDPGELYHIVKLLPRYDLIIGFRYRKIYGTIRILMSAALNLGVRVLFGRRFRDITCGLKLIRRDVVDDLEITSTSPFVGGEIVIRAAMKGYHIGEVGISTYPREFGDSAVISWANIVATIREIMRLRREIFRNRTRRLVEPVSRPRESRPRLPMS